jgi:hypothetical protein
MEKISKLAKRKGLGEVVVRQKDGLNSKRRLLTAADPFLRIVQEIPTQSLTSAPD